MRDGSEDEGGTDRGGTEKEAKAIAVEAVTRLGGAGKRLSGGLWLVGGGLEREKHQG